MSKSLIILKYDVRLKNEKKIKQVTLNAVVRYEKYGSLSIHTYVSSICPNLRSNDFDQNFKTFSRWHESPCIINVFGKDDGDYAG